MGGDRHHRLASPVQGIIINDYLCVTQNNIIGDIHIQQMSTQLSATTTAIPSFSRDLAISLLMPEESPVTSATLDVPSAIILNFNWGDRFFALLRRQKTPCNYHNFSRDVQLVTSGNSHCM